jgi:hypothetical protein
MKTNNSRVNPRIKKKLTDADKVRMLRTTLMRVGKYLPDLLDSFDEIGDTDREMIDEIKTTLKNTK